MSFGRCPQFNWPILWRALAHLVWVMHIQAVPDSGNKSSPDPMINSSMTWGCPGWPYPTFIELLTPCSTRGTPMVRVMGCRCDTKFSKKTAPCWRERFPSSLLDSCPTSLLFIYIPDSVLCSYIPAWAALKIRKVPAGCYQKFWGLP